MQTEALYDIYLRHPHICNDTRKIEKDCIYWGIRGERFDGNAFAADALDKGAAYAVIDNPVYALDERYILVEDSIMTLQQLARHHRRQLGIPVLAITGSNGKTTSKELVWRVLASQMEAFATPGNLNNHIGLPLSLLQLTKRHQVAIIELGANHQGENAMLCEICLPDMGIITNIGKDHLEGFGGMDGVEKANMELFDYLRRMDGLAFVNTDDERITRNTNGLKQLSYGCSDNAMVKGRILSRFPFLDAEIQTGEGDKIQAHTHLFGSFHVYNLLAATAIGTYFHISPDNIKQALESYVPQNNRSQLIRHGSNTFILDAYNANPSSMQGGITDFADHPAAKKVLLLGDMFELGEDSEKEHRAILDMMRWEAFKAVGLAGEHFFQFYGHYPAQFFKTTEELKTWYQQQHFEDTVFYLKGSRGMKMETVIQV